MTLDRGTSNSNERGSAEDRRRRKRWMLVTFGDGKTVKCYRCPRILVYTTMEVDRIVPGVLGGRYRRDNIRPACSACNIETGNEVRDLLAQGADPDELRRKYENERSQVADRPTAGPAQAG